MHRTLLVVFVVELLCESSASHNDNPKYLSKHQRREALGTLHSSFPAMTRLEVVGQTHGSQVYAFVISNHSKHQFLRPRVHVLADFPAGLELLLKLASHLLREYGQDQNVRNLVSQTEVHLLFYPSTMTVRSKATADCAQDGKLEDLSGFPDYFGVQGIKFADGSKVDSKVRFIVEWLKRSKFVLGARLQGGGKDIVAAYGFHNTAKDGVVTPTPDDDALRHLSKSYVRLHPRMKKGTPQCSGGRLGGFPEGITPAAAWKRRAGLMEDFAYASEGVLELALAVSCCAVPAESSLSELWEENRDPLIAFLGDAQRGIRGYVKGPEGTHVAGALLTIRGRNVPFRSSDQGEFWRILLPGSYLLVVTANGFLPAAVRASVPGGGRQAAPLVITMRPSTHPIDILPIDSYTTEETVQRRGDPNAADAAQAVHFAVLAAWAAVGGVTRSPRLSVW